MPIFTSSREKRLWLYTLLVLIAISTTLFLGDYFVVLFGNQKTQANIGMLGMILIGATILIHGIISKPKKTEIVIWLGLTAVYLFLFLRLGHTERSHMMEYGVLAIFMHKALLERARQVKKTIRPALLAFLATFVIGVLDECVQIYIPNRVFDTIDILFNSLAAFMSIGTSMVLSWVRIKIRNT